MISDRNFSSRRTVTWLGGVAALATAFALGCSDTTQPKVKPTPAGMGRLAVYAVTPASSGITGLSLTVSGPGIVKADGTADTLVFNLTMTNGTATGSITIPSGPARVITGHAYVGATETHRGSVTTDIVQGTNPTVTITLVPFVGDVPITINVGTSLVIVTPDSVEAAIGDTLRFKAKVLDNTGTAISGVVRWASVDPARVTIDTLGLATVRDTGKAHIVATYGTVGGYAEIHATRASTVSYHLTWNGSVSTNWTDTANWTPHGTATVSRVPTAADSVVIPSAPANQPMINACSDAQVMDLVVQAGAQLSSGCYGYGVKVVRSAVSQGKINVPLHVQKGATLGGLLGDLYIEGDSVSLADTVNARNVQITAAGSGLLLNGRRMTVNGDLGVSNMSRVVLGGARLLVTGNLALNDSSWVVVKNAADTLNVRGNFTLGTHKSIADSLFSAGVLRVGGSIYATNPASFAVMGSLSTILDGSGTQYVEVDSTALNNGTWNGVRAAGPGHVYFSPYYYYTTRSLKLTDFTLDSAASVDFSPYYYGGVLEVSPLGGELVVHDTLNAGGNVQIDGKLTIASKPTQGSGAPAVPTPTLGGSGTMTLTGMLSAGAGSQVSVTSLVLKDSTGTTNVQGGFAPGSVTFAAAKPGLKAGLGYRSVAFDGATTGAQLPDTMTFNGDLTLSHKSRLALGNHRLLVTGNLTMNDTSWVELTNANDTLNVRGNLTVGAKNMLSGTPLFSAGVLRVGGGITATTNAFSLATAGTKTYLDGSGTQYVYVSPKALNYTSGSGATIGVGTWADLHVANTGKVWIEAYTSSDTVAFPNFSIDSSSSVNLYPYYSQAMVITPAGGELTVNDTLNAYYGTVQVNGKLTLAPQGSATSGSFTPPQPAIAGGGNLIVTGALTTGTGSNVSVTNLTLNDPSGTSNVSGSFSPGTVTFAAAAPIVKPSLGYKNVALSGTTTGVTLSDSSTFNGSLTLTGGSRLALNGHRLLVTGTMGVKDSSWFEMTNAVDTLNVRGNLSVASSKNTLTPSALLSAGVLRLGGNLDAYSSAGSFSFATSGTLKTLIDGTGTQYIQVNPKALNYTNSSPTGGTWDNVHVIGNNRVEIDGYTSADTLRLTGFSIDSSASVLLYPYYSTGLAITPQGGTLTVNDTLVSYSGNVRINGGLSLAAQGTGGSGTLTPAAPSINGGGTLTVTGKLTTGAGSFVTVGSLVLNDSTGTGYVSGSFSPTTVTFASSPVSFKPALAYNNVNFSGAQSVITLTDTAKFNGNAVLSNGTRLVLNNHRLLVTGNMTLNDTSWFEETNANDTLNVRGQLQFGAKNTTGLLSDGVLRVGGYMYAKSANSFAPSRNHQTIFDGASTQNVEVDTAAVAGSWPNIRVDNPTTVNFTNWSSGSGSITASNFRIDSAGTVTFYYPKYSITPASGTLNVGRRLSVNGAGAAISGALSLANISGSTPTIDGSSILAVTGMLTTGDSTAVTMTGTLALSDSTGTNHVAGTFSPGVLSLKGSNQQVKPGMAYKALDIIGSALFYASGTSTYAFNGPGTVETGATMTVNSGVTVGFCGNKFQNNGTVSNSGTINAGTFGGNAITGSGTTAITTACP